MTEISAATGKLLALSMLRGIGPATLRKLSGLANFDNATRAELATMFPNIAGPLGDDIGWAVALEAADRQREEAEKIGARIISGLDADYPSLLLKSKDDPFLLFVHGKLHSDPEKSVAIIGTREPTPHGKVVAERLTQYFVEQNWSVVSGLAIGCDATAHQSAVQAGGHTVAVLAHGLQTIAPTRHRKLADEILMSGGALVTEYRFGQEPQPTQFVRRDKTQAGLARGVVMIQSDVKGGSLHASRAALEYRRWLAVPYPTERDKANNEPKIQANLLIADGSTQERLDLLRCSPKILDNVYVIRDKQDYAQLTAPVPDSQNGPQVQGQLI